MEVKNAIWRDPRPLANVQIPDGIVCCVFVASFNEALNVIN